MLQTSQDTEFLPARGTPGVTIGWQGENMRLAGKVAVVTGGSSGIGRATAELFAAEGAHVAVASGSDIRKAEVVVEQIVANGGRAIPVKMDVRSPTDIARALRDVVVALGPVDILVNSAGVYVPTPLGQTTEEQFDRLIDTHLKGTFFAIQGVATGMKSRRSGRIVNVASVAAYKGSALYPIYSTVKAGIVMMTRALALDLAPFDVAINAIAPGNTATPLNEADRQSEEVMARKRLTTASPRVYSPATEMAETILFLADGRVRAMHGSTILLDEGLSA
jgi:NAD(P)-dependent dehydrogenase (short-subunit alcohol dehydrogenase family)